MKSKTCFCYFLVFSGLTRYNCETHYNNNVTTLKLYMPGEIIWLFIHLKLLFGAFFRCSSNWDFEITINSEINVHLAFVILIQFFRILSELIIISKIIYHTICFYFMFLYLAWVTPSFGYSFKFSTTQVTCA